MKIKELYEDVVKESVLIVGYFSQYAAKNFTSFIKQEVIAYLKAEFKGFNGQLFETKYQAWYTKCLLLLSIVMPERKQEFVRYYEPDPKRKELTLLNYTLLDAIHIISRGSATPAQGFNILNSQIAIIKGLGIVIDEKLYNLKTLIENEVFESELESAEYLLQKGFNRSAGAICGVLIERHLASMCKTANIKISKKDPSISDYNSTLYKESVIDLTQNKYLIYLSDIRNKCDHSKEQEPKEEEIKDLISGTKKVILTY